MRNKFYLFISLSISLVLVFLIFLNAQYPFKNLEVGRWSVGYSFANNVFPPPKLILDNILPYTFIDSITGSSNNYIADPFFIKEKDSFYLFVEQKGIENADIALFVSADGNKYDYKGIVLDEDFHISYPQVFKYKNEFYMLPETKQAENLLLYKARNFPYDWQIEDTLLKGVELKDPSLLLSDELNLIVAVDDHLKQFMFTAGSLNGKWKEVENYFPRLGNETRPGGRFFKVNNTWYLPIQDRTDGYGSGISIFKLIHNDTGLKLEMAESSYLSAQANIKWFNRGMHQLDIQKIDEKFYMVYDGDRNTDNTHVYQVKRSLQFFLYDVYNYFYKE
ncbi:hypothetical protein [Gillisia sp. CAL575]|uniref:glucosamine inositolphosphorylceramide transferase family protein n=1 Tax=Gillisia sp. CAL575 TaxID=985255 RepID=UPI0003A23490|nr:hypothetical protein [Gillisia sp. CAL575]